MNLPTGTVTLLFAEIERASASLQTVTDSHLPVSGLRKALVFALQEQNGALLMMEDDKLRAAFSTPEEALRAAVAIQQIYHPERAELPAEARSSVRRFRVALHTGPAQVAEGTYVGATVTQTTQLMEAGHSGQILVSAECARALRNRLPEGVRLRELGQFHYAEQSGGEGVFQVTHADLPTEFPPVRLMGAAATNLPGPWTSFVGRKTELAELHRQMADTRILTLIGSEGIGKSRLVARLASDLRSLFPDGVWGAELPYISDAELVPGVVAWALGAPAMSETALTDALIAHLQHRKALLLLDTGEGNRAACARLVTALSGRCPGVKFLVSARKGLGLRDEAIYCVSGLSTAGKAGDTEAERLCRERAAPTELNTQMLNDLCMHLNGIPLALELAIGGLALQSEEAFRGLTWSIYDLTQGAQPSWEQTLQGVLNWSYQQLLETEQLLLERLSVFQAGWSLEAATAVCCDETLPSELLSTLLEALRARAFISVEERAGFARERLCDAVRHDAERRLARRGEAAEMRRRYTDYFVQLAEQGVQGLTGLEREEWRAYLEREYVNFRAALLALHQEAAGGESERRLATALLPILEASGRAAEGQALLKRTTETQAAAAASTEDYPTIRDRYSAVIAQCREVGDKAREVRNLDNLARLAVSHEDFATAMGCCEQAVAVYRAQGDTVQEARMLHRLGSAARDGSEYLLARKHYESALELNRALGRRSDEAHNLNGLARVALLQGDSGLAVQRFQEGLVLFRELGDHAWEAHNMGQILRLSLPHEPLWERAPGHEAVKN